MTSFSHLAALIGLLCIVVPVLREIERLYTNYRLAKQTGLHILVVPLDPYGLPWRIGSRLCAPLLHKLEWCRIIDATWAWEDDARRHAKYGETFVVVSPARNMIFTSDKVAIEEVLAKRKVFIKTELYEPMNVFGKNLDTVNGEDWARHRKITAPCFNERVSSFVWDESVRQSRDMLAQWLSQPGGRTSKMVDDTRIIALHVLYAAGFGVKQDFNSGARIPAPGHKLSHRDALMTMLTNLVTSFIVAPQGPFFKKLSALISSHVKDVLEAVEEYQQYTDEAIASERKRQVSDHGAQKHNLMSTMIRISDQAKSEGLQSAVQLTDDELKGNIFIFNLAGHDTTANTLAYAFALLAIHPEVQSWVDEEIDEVLQGVESPRYEDVHSRLKRVLAVMYETLRLYGPAPQIPRGTVAPSVLTVTNPNPTASDSATTTLYVPPRTDVVLNVHAMQTTPATYPNHTIWDPKRWVSSSSSSPSSTLHDEKFLHPEQGFAAWAGGPRICPGMKFAQVEFAGVLSTVLRKAWIAPSVKGGGGEAAAARNEVRALLRDSHLLGATLSMRRPEELWLRVERRASAS